MRKKKKVPCEWVLLSQWILDSRRGSPLVHITGTGRDGLFTEGFSVGTHQCRMEYLIHRGVLCWQTRVVDGVLAKILSHGGVLRWYKKWLTALPPKHSKHMVSGVTANTFQTRRICYTRALSDDSLIHGGVLRGCAQVVWR